jgi:hypothetical protein|tara:strand:- start:424 stop:1485 length:1062 start_codon:yes stop_codon:yes gene_type:complete
MKTYKYNDLLETVEIISDRFFFLLKKIDLNYLWDSNNSLEIEIKKSFIKSLIRHDDKTEDLQKLILKNYKLKDNKRFKYTEFYPMIHMSKDKIENGGYHFDQVDNVNLETLWIAITKYEYPALSVADFKLKNSFINKILIKSNIAKIFSKNIYPQQGDINIWDGKLIHSGNFNISSKPVLAMQMKIISLEEDFIFENIKEYSEEIDYSKKKSCIENNEFMREYKIYLSLIDQILIQSRSKLSINDDFKKLIEVIKKIPDVKSQKLSFALSILSQRIRSFENNFSTQVSNLKKFTSSLDYISLLIGSENLVSFKRLYNDDIKKENILENIIQNDIFNVCQKKYKKFKVITNHYK